MRIKIPREFPRGAEVSEQLEAPPSVGQERRITKIRITTRTPELEPDANPDTEEFEIEDWPVESVETVGAEILGLLARFKAGSRLVASAFASLPSAQDYPDYYALVTKPVALDTVRNSLGTYQSMAAFCADILRMFANCRIYNQANSLIVQDANTLEAVLRTACECGRQGLPVADAAVTQLPLLFEGIAKSDIRRVARVLANYPAFVNKLAPANLFAQTTFTWAPLHCAAYYGNQRIIQLLMDSGATIEIEDTWFGGRPLAWAAFAGHHKICRLFIEIYKADKIAVNKNGQAAFDLIPENSTPEIWEQAFNPTKTEIPSITLRIPAAAIKEAVIHRSTPSYSRSQAVLAKPIESSRNTPIGAMPNSRDISTAKRPESQLQASVVRVKQAQHQQNMGHVMHETAYSQYTAHNIDATSEARLIASIEIVSAEDGVRVVLPFRKSDLAAGVSGHAITVPRSVKTVKLTVNCSSDSSTCNGFNCSTFYISTNIAGMQVPQQRQDALQFKSMTGGRKHECVVSVGDSLSSLEIVASSTGDDGKDVFQSIVLFVSKS